MGGWVDMGDTLSCHDLVGFGLASEHFPRHIHQNILLLHRLHFINVRPPRSVPDVSFVAGFPGRGKGGGGFARRRFLLKLYKE